MKGESAYQAYLESDHCSTKKRKDESWAQALERMDRRREEFIPRFKNAWDEFYRNSLKQGRKKSDRNISSLRPLSEEQVQKIEQNLGGIRLPKDYRDFLIKIGYSESLSLYSLDADERPKYSAARVFPLVKSYHEKTDSEYEKLKLNPVDHLEQSMSPSLKHIAGSYYQRQKMSVWDGQIVLYSGAVSLIVTGEMRGRVWAYNDFDRYILEPAEEADHSCSFLNVLKNENREPVDFIDYVNLFLINEFRDIS